jgi:hypothetical protein
MDSAKQVVLLAALMAPWMCLAADQTCSACDDAESPYCLRLNSDEGYGPSFKQLHDRLVADAHKDITAADLMGMFNIYTDPCHRSATTYSAGKWTNTGSACRIAARFSIGPLTLINTVLIIPDRLSLTTQANGAVITAIPDSPAPFLKFADINLDRDWGGFIEKVTADGSRIMLQVRSGCIQVSYSS